MNFIREVWADIEVCDEIISYFDSRQVSKANVSENIKDSFDFYVDKKELSTYYEFLRKEILTYAGYFIYSENNLDIAEPMIIQKYPIGGGYKLWHCERNHPINYHRQLSFMTYLNTVLDGGTEFVYQNKVVQAVKSKTLIWPADWTHTHRSQISSTTEKYIVTGWINTVDYDARQQ